MTTTGGSPRTPDWMAGGRRVKCAAGGGGDGGRIGEEVLSIIVSFTVSLECRSGRSDG